MLYNFFKWLQDSFNVPGAGLFQYLSFRILAAVLLSLLISAVFGKTIIRRLAKLQIGEDIRALGLQGQESKKGTPTMGGFIILLAILVPTLLIAQVNNVYILLMILTTVWCGAIGFFDDYIKVFKKNKEGLSGRYKIIGQVGLGLIIGSVLYFNSNVIMQRKMVDNMPAPSTQDKNVQIITKDLNGKAVRYVQAHTPITTVPFTKNHEFSYASLLTWIDKSLEKYTWIVYVLIVTIIIVAVSNAANLTDGIDGLATGVSAIIGAGIGVFAYVSGNYVFADYLGVMYIPNLGELSIFIAAFIGACIGFLWYNCFPAQVFMGDTGSLALGGIIATLSIIIRKEILIPIFCFVFLAQNLSVTMQTLWFKYTRKKYGVGRRIFLMAPLHHHYQKLGYHENKIVVRFWIVSIFCIVIALLLLKLR
jgi:phospho-N-acetylmuramoyl-pentapeptide-transferase